MPKFVVPTNADVRCVKSFLDSNDFFGQRSGEAILEFHPRWMHIDPMGLSMIAAWGSWAKRNNMDLDVKNLTRKADYAARMRIFEHLGIKYQTQFVEHEEAGRFLPVRQIKNSADIRTVISDVSALLHLDKEPDALDAVRYCMSELLRNVIEHSGSPDGAFVCAHNYRRKGLHRVTLAVADCGIGISQHLSRNYPEVASNDLEAMRLALSPGITGAVKGLYGSSENAGQGLYITRSIAKGLGGYFLVVSGSAGYRLMRTDDSEEQLVLWPDPFLDRASQWQFKHPWKGTIVAVEIPTDRISDFQGLFKWVLKHVPERKKSARRIKFT